MSKHDLLTEQEFQAYTPNQNILSHLLSFTRASGQSPDQLRVLDWGCGRGRDVLWLRQQGYQAFGVDIDPLPVENGRPLIRRMGYPDQCLALLDSDGMPPFPDDFFDYVFSGNVFEHIADLRGVCGEMARVTGRGGGGYHVFPAHRQLMEGHLFMPFVHWVPAGILRRLLIRLFVTLGREPHWIEVRGSSVAMKTDFYYGYTIRNTFYRPYARVRSIFEENGFSVSFKTLDHPRIKASPMLSRVARLRGLRGLLNHMLLTFKLVEMEVEKKE